MLWLNALATSGQTEGTDCRCFQPSMKSESCTTSMRFPCWHSIVINRIPEAIQNISIYQPTFEGHHCARAPNGRHVASIAANLPSVRAGSPWTAKKARRWYASMWAAIRIFDESRCEPRCYGIFTYKTGPFFEGKCRCQYSSTMEHLGHDETPWKRVEVCGYVKMNKMRLHLYVYICCHKLLSL